MNTSESTPVIHPAYMPEMPDNSVYTNITLVQPNQNGRSKFITLVLVGATVKRRWGLKGGTPQETEHTYTAINAGKKNELTPEQAAEADFYRVIAKKKKEGYQLIGGMEEPPSAGLTFDTIPTEFCCSKPNAKISESKVNKALSNDRAILQTKYNGLCHYVLSTSEGDIKLFTRRMDDHTAKYPTIVQALKGSEFCPPNSILIGELCVDPTMGLPHMEAFKKACEISRVDTLEGKLKDDLTESLIRQSKHSMRLAIFGVLYFGGEDIVSTCTYEQI